MKTMKTLVIAIWLLSQISLAEAASSGSAQSVQINMAGPPVPILYLHYITNDGVIPQQPFYYDVVNIFAALQCVKEKNGANGGVTYSFTITNKLGISLVSQFTIEWLKNGAVVETRSLSGQDQVVTENWQFATTQVFGKNTALIRNDWVSNIVGNSVGAPKARFPYQQFLIDGPGVYSVRIWATVDSKPVFAEHTREIPAFYVDLRN